eukprot:5460549-Pleurochrysis_carterae.AAC.2
MAAVASAVEVMVLEQAVKMAVEMAAAEVGVKMVLGAVLAMEAAMVLETAAGTMAAGETAVMMAM